ncbi:MAG: glycosyltransferase [Bacteroidota bacterium]
MIKFLKLSGIYRHFFPTIYQSYIPNHESLNYEAHYRSLMQLKIAEFDSYKTNLELLGGYECVEIVMNDERLQKKWAAENKLKYNESNWKKEIAIAQIRQFQPNILLDSARVFDSKDRNKLRKELNFDAVLSWDGVPFSNPKDVIDVDLVLTCIPSIVKKYNKQGTDAALLPFSFDHTILEAFDGQLKYNVSFCGSMMGKYHQMRSEVIEHLINNKVDIDLFIGNLGLKEDWFSRAQLRELAKLNIGQFLKLTKFQSRNLGNVFGIEMYKTLAASKMTLNVHATNVHEAGNMRLIEAVGAGTCLVTDWKANIKDYFIPDKEIVTFKTKEEALEKINYLLAHEEERAAIAKAGQVKVLAEYTDLNRMKLLHQLMETIRTKKSISV